MLKKLQELLFEEEDEELVEDDDIEVEVKPSRRKPTMETIEAKPRQKPAPAPVPAPVQQPAEPARPVMSRIEMTQPIQTQKEEPKPAASSSGFNTGSVFKTPSAVQHANPRPIQEPTLNIKPVEQPRPSSFSGLTLDKGKKEEPKVKPAPVRPAQQVQQPVQQQVVRPKPAAQMQAAKTASPRGSVYEFKPVISPMFGVDEKDMDAMTVTAKIGRVSPSTEINVSKIISPIYGTNLDAGAIAMQSTSEKSGRMDSAVYTSAARQQEDRIPEFSLDDILSARDEEFSRSAIRDFGTPDVDETVVIDSEHFSSYRR
jgi:hypothetical protein